MQCSMVFTTTLLTRYDPSSPPPTLSDTCDRGQFLFGATCAEPGSCKPCGQYKYQDTESHREPDCKDQSTCNSGHYLSKATEFAAGQCKACRKKVTYQDENVHRLGSCKNQLRCGQGRFLFGASASAKGSCKNCPTGTFLEATNHLENSCQNDTM